ncbi:MAG: efflux RND transporter periplasmic adaptor subunit [Desulfobacterales bacterium]
MNDSAQTAIERTLGIGAEAAEGRRTLKRWLGAGGLIIAGLGVLYLVSTLRAGGDTVRYITQPARTGSLVVKVSATGNLAATNEVEVGSELSGIVERVVVDFNDQVKVGQPLAYLDSTKFDAAVLKSRAALASAQARLQEARATLKEKEKALLRQRKTRELTGGRAPSMESLEAAEAELERARAGIVSAEAAIQEALANLKSVETDLAKTVIYSPVDGIVLNRSVEPGQTVAASLQAPVLFNLAEDLTQMELQVDVDEADVGQVKEGQAATFTVDAYPERRFEARITQVRYGSETTDGVVTYKTVLKVDNPDMVLRPGMTATADITVQEVEKALLVPNAALRYAPPQKAQKGGGRGLIDSLLPGHRRRASSPSRASGSDARQQRVWVLREGEPLSVTVETGPSDGSVTVVNGGDIQTGTEVVVDTIAVKS